MPLKTVNALGFLPNLLVSADASLQSPHHVLTRLSTAPVSPYLYLAQRQHTAHAVLPVHTTGEFLLFNKMLDTTKYFVTTTGRQPIAARSSQNINFKLFAKDWTDQVHLAALEKHEKDTCVHYKLPEQLEQHHQIWAASRARIATLSNTAQMRKPITDIVTNPNRRARVLPAIGFDDITSPVVRRDKGKARVVHSSSSEQETGKILNSFQLRYPNTF